MNLKKRLTLLSDENRTLTQKVGLQGAGEAALSKKLAEKLKEFDDLATKLRSMQTSQGMTESHIRDEVAKIHQENLKLRIQTEHAQAEITRLGVLIGERDTVIMKQKQLIGGLEKTKTDGGRLPDHNYILRTEKRLDDGGIAKTIDD